MVNFTMVASAFGEASNSQMGSVTQRKLPREKKALVPVQYYMRVRTTAAQRLDNALGCGQKPRIVMMHGHVRGTFNCTWLEPPAICRLHKDREVL